MQAAEGTPEPPPATDPQVSIIQEGALPPLSTSGNHPHSHIHMRDGTDSGTPPTDIRESPPQSQTLQRLNFVLVLVALILSVYSPFSDAWQVSSSEEENFSMTTAAGLDDMAVTVCIDGECTTHTDDFGSMYDNCTKNLNDANITNGSQYDLCQELGDIAIAGIVEMVFLTLSIILLLGAAALIVIAHQGRIIPHYEKAPLAAGTMLLFGLLLWRWLLPEDDVLTLGRAAKAVVSAAVLTLLSGISTSVWRFYTPGERPAGLGVRVSVDGAHNEFPLWESEAGHKTVSMVVDGDLLRVSQARREESGTVVDDHFMSLKSAFTGFTHQRYDWLDTTKHIWWLLTVVGFILLFMVKGWIPLAILIIGALFSLVQFADPELLIFETHGGRHRVLLYRFASNRELMNYSMDSVDDVIQNLLQGGEFDCQQISEFAVTLELKREADRAATRAEVEENARLAKKEMELAAKEAALAEKAAEIAAADKAKSERIAAEKSAALRAARQEELANREAELAAKEAEIAAAEKAAAEKAAAEKAKSERIAAEKAAADKAKSERIAAEKAAAEKTEAERARTEQIAAEGVRAERASAEPVTSETAAPPPSVASAADGQSRATIPPAPPPPSTPLGAAPTQPILATKSHLEPLPPPPPPHGAPPVHAPPPPAVGQFPPPSPPAGAGILPPPPSGGVPLAKSSGATPPPPHGLPPPPPSAKHPPIDPFAPQPRKEASSYTVKAAPRQESLSTAEAMDLLSDLNE